MVPTRLDGTPWPRERADMVLRRIKHDVAAHFRRRDTEQFGIPADGKVFRMVDVQDGGRMRGGAMRNDLPRPQNMVIDPVWAASKHSGRDSIREFRTRWATFCGKPRDDSGVRPAAAYTAEDPLGTQTRGATSMAATVPWGESDPFAPAVKRGPGRPRKQRPEDSESDGQSAADNPDGL